MKRFLLDPSVAAGDRYSPVVISPTAIARRASSSAVLRRVLAMSLRLARDPYTDYVAEFYKKGLEICGDDWGFMDLVTVLYAVAEMGQPENYLEIGVRRGRSACAIAAASPATDIYAFDVWEQEYGGNENPGPELVRSELAKFRHQGRVAFVDGDSHATVPEFLRTNPHLSFDCINVDGDHSLDGAWDDLRNVVPRLRVGGVIVFDDTSNPYCPGLDKIWNDLLRADPGISGFSYAGIGTGVSFGIRMRESAFTDVRKRRFRL
jgi:hypothetical protein